MPQAKGKGNWMVNPRVQPPSTKVRLDNSAAKLENRYLGTRLLADMESIDNLMYRKQADQNHDLKKAKKDAHVVFTYARVLNNRKRPGSSSGPDETTFSLSDPDPLKQKSSEAASLSSDDFEDSGDDQKHPSASSVRRQTRPSTSATVPSTNRSSLSSTSTRNGDPRRGRPKTAGAPNAKDGGGHRSYQHLKDMLENDSQRELKKNDARAQAMLAMAEKTKEEDRQLQMRLQRFYTDLDQFIKRTKTPSQRVPKETNDHQNFLLRFASLGIDTQK